MESAIPLLNPDQIQQLNNMIHGISEQNKKKLDDVLSEVADVESLSVLNLYKLVVDEWGKKQKIIDNLCHFSLTMMATVQLLFDQKQDHQDKLSTAEVVIDNLQRHIDDLGVPQAQRQSENEKIKLKINEAQTHIESISGEKEKFEQLYKSQSCCDFVDHAYHSEIQHRSEVVKECQTCGQHKSLLQKQKDEFIKETSELREEKKDLQRKFQELMEEHKLVKMEIELAEIAVKDALSYRESSICNKSDILNRSDQIYTTKSHAQFMNGQLQCFSNLDDSFNYERRQILSNQILSDHQNIPHFVSTPELPSHDLEEAELKLATTHESTTIQSPFKKKVSNKNEERRYNTEVNEKEQSVQDCLKTEISQHQTKLTKDRKTVSLQCNLLKNIPKIKMFPKKIQEVERVVKPQTKRQPELLKKKQVNKMAQSLRVISSKSQIIKSSSTKNPAPPVPAQQNSISRFISFLSSKVITNRIKLK